MEAENDMIIERNLSKHIVFSEDNLLNALRKISENKSRLVFSVSESGELEGILTDGDFRRWLLEGNQVNLDVPVSAVSNKKYVSLPSDAPMEEIGALFNERIAVVPLLDKRRHLVAIAQRQPAEFKIGDFVLAPDKPAFLVAEIGNNHNGRIELAYRLVDKQLLRVPTAQSFKCAQCRNFIVTGDASDPSEDLGAQYTLDLLSRFQLNIEDMLRVFDYCKERSILPLCTPWDNESLNVLEDYGMQAYKLASADLTNHELLDAIARTGKPLICSTGMSSESEISEAVRKLKQLDAKYVLLHCNSTYPAPFKDIHLNYLDRLSQIGDCLVGYSGHERGIAVAIAAVAKGAKVIEKHFTLDRPWKATTTGSACYRQSSRRWNREFERWSRH